MKVLLVEDDATLRAYFARVLCRAMHDVIEAANGVEALDKFNRTQPAVVVTDILMPEKDGLEIIKEIRAAAPWVGIVSISGGGGAFGPEKYLEAAKTFGADVALKKPVSAADLVASVAGLSEKGSH